VRAVVQRVGAAEVGVDGEVVGRISAGLVVFLGVGPQDDERTARHLAGRVATLRVFPDATGRMNLSVSQTDPPGGVLVVSQFTLYADASRGHRPSFIGAGPAELAARLCDVFCEALLTAGIAVAGGRFGARMRVGVVNDGPVTVVLSSGEPPWPADAG